MAGWYRCRRCGRFPITDALPGLNDAEDIFRATFEHLVVVCPKCGRKAKRCRYRLNGLETNQR